MPAPGKKRINFECCSVSIYDPIIEPESCRHILQLCSLPPVYTHVKKESFREQSAGLFDRTVQIINAGCDLRLAARTLRIWARLFLYRVRLRGYPPRPLNYFNSPGDLWNQLVAIWLLGAKLLPDPYFCSSQQVFILTT